jgi:hypothetical protein
MRAAISSKEDARFLVHAFLASRHYSIKELFQGITNCFVKTGG